MKPEELRFVETHEWIAPDGTVGISDHAQHEITDVVFVELPKPGRVVKSGEAVAAVESVKAAFDIYAPVSGTIAAVNESVTKTPGLVNQSPYEAGWLFKVKADREEERNGLMTHETYQTFLKSETH
ncbi:MAG TPA: glycine cleavage system protein GcvH [Elusimicrobiota bacterium]|nr:glycine cleavage system protein GcvH [Elusimicrobiota bacterium]